MMTEVAASRHGSRDETEDGCTRAAIAVYHHIHPPAQLVSQYLSLGLQNGMDLPVSPIAAPARDLSSLAAERELEGRLVARRQRRLSTRAAYARESCCHA